jgi:uncharacterized HAD superfamily protein
MKGTIALLQSLAPHFQIHIISGRWEMMRRTTEEWLATHQVPYDTLRMYTPADTPTKNYIYKVRHLEQLRAQGLTPVLFLEDESRTAEYLETHGGLPVLRVSPGYETHDAGAVVTALHTARAYRAYPSRLFVATKTTLRHLHRPPLWGRRLVSKLGRRG